MKARNATLPLQEIETLTANELIGRAVCFVLRPETQGHITAVHVFRAGRTISVAYWNDGEPAAVDCDDFQVQLCEDLNAD